MALGGAGRLWGALLGAVVFTLFKDRLSALDPACWYFWLGRVAALGMKFEPVSERTGDASTIKMIRSIAIKGFAGWSATATGAA